MAKSNCDKKYKILILGDSSVGKSCILKRFADNEFVSTFMPTIGVDFKIKSINVDGKIIKLQIWDTAGQERFSKITESFYRGAHGVFFVYDMSNGKSFDSIGRWLRNFEENSDEEPIKFLIGNKCDLKDLRQIEHSKGLKVATEFGLQFKETSAKENINISEIFLEMARSLAEKTTTPLNNVSSKGSDPKKINLEENQSNYTSYFKMNGMCCQ